MPTPSDPPPRPAFAKFSEEAYLAEQPDVREAVERGVLPDGFTHYLRNGVDENRNPRLNRDAVAIAGNLEACLLGESGAMALLGWLADEGRGPTRWTLSTGDFELEIPADAIFRFARPDVEADQRRSFDYGFLALAGSPSTTLLQQKLDFRVASPAAEHLARVAPEVIADQRLLDLVITRLASAEAHGGAAAAAHEFLSGSAGHLLTSLFRGHVERHAGACYVESFRPRPVARSFVVVLPGPAETILTQPMLFEPHTGGSCEWIYACNSRVDGEAALRLAQMAAELYDVMITVVAMSEDVGYSAAANAAVAAAHCQTICMLSPDVYPLDGGADGLRAAMAALQPGDRLVGGLLFRDGRNLAQSGLYLERDVFLRGGRAAAVKLARLTRFDGGTPFEPARWRTRKTVPVVSKAFMAFDRARFESRAGFSSNYIYDGYEDADLALRWSAGGGRPVIDPALRLALLETSAHHETAETYRAARVVNRHLFSMRYNAAFEADPAAMSAMREDE